MANPKAHSQLLRMVGLKKNEENQGSERGPEGVSIDKTHSTSMRLYFFVLKTNRQDC